jgi:hypothetical protein
MTVTTRIKIITIPYINATNACIAEIIPKSPGHVFSWTWMSPP